MASAKACDALLMWRFRGPRRNSGKRFRNFRPLCLALLGACVLFSLWERLIILIIPNHDGEDSENWDAFYYPIGDARKTLCAFAALLSGKVPPLVERWDEFLLSCL
jgi:hypothetical protein